jgi:protein-disulfide isomerase
MFLKRLLVTSSLVLTASVFGVFSVQAQSNIVASINGENIQLSALSKRNSLEIYEAEKSLYDLRMNNLRGLLISKLIRLDPKSQGLEDSDYISQYIAKPSPVSDEQVDAFIIQRKIPDNKINTNLKEQVRVYLIQQQIALQVDQWFRQVSKANNVSINLEKPLEPRFEVSTDGAPFRGGENAKVTIVEFSDFQCPYCTKANETLKELSAFYGDKIKIVYKHYPLTSIHPVAPKAAEASICAQQQGMDKFWALHDEMFNNARGLSVGIIKDQAKKIGLDVEQFNQCLTSGKFAQQVKAELDEGTALGVTSTPAFFINGRFIKGALPFEVFNTMIDEELASNTK